MKALLGKVTLWVVYIVHCILLTTASLELHCAHTPYAPPPRKPPDKLSPLLSSLIPCHHLSSTHPIPQPVPHALSQRPRAAENVLVSPHNNAHLVHRSIRVLDLGDPCSVA
mmetsp:Transcript_17905/g.26410  ORF Transcript_17905/g.26410 Transcript_17905/m.26410 type:complete len:111 (-) Transcript_17905:439-771(-)